jgi:Cd2+/Zn2+-exporting ATPase
MRVHRHGHEDHDHHEPHCEHCNHHSHGHSAHPGDNHAPSHDHHHGGACCGHDHSEGSLRARLIFVFSGGVLLLLSGLLLWWRADQPDVAHLCSMAGAIVASIPIFRDAIRGLMARDTQNTEFYMNQFITLAVLACFAIGQYFTAGVIAIILVLGHVVEDRSLLGASEAIQGLLKLSRVSARRVRQGVEETVDAEALAEGDIVRLRPGDTIPADGRVVSGWSMVNQATITGESMPVEVRDGVNVFAGTSNLTGSVEMEVTRTGDRTVIGRVKHIVEEAQETRAPIVRLTEEYARYYAPLILLIAGFTLFFTRDATRAISVIVVSIPCAFLLAGPSAMVAALASASRLGILVKSVRFFEAANDIDTVVFDKTGTLTTGQLKVAEICVQDGWSENEMLALAAATGRHSTHPVARAVLEAAGARGLEIAEATDMREQHGCGVLAKVGGREVIAGRAAWLQEHRVVMPQENGHGARSDLSALHVAVDGAFAGVILLSDTVREEASRVSHALREEGVERFVMLTGDRRSAAESIATALGIDEFEAECLPEQKLQSVYKLKSEGHKVMVVGDGVNDAPALAAGNLSVVMGALGSDVAIQTADIALMASDLARLPQFLALSHQTLRIINQNMLCGFLFIIAAIVLSSIGVISPIAAAFVHECGALFVVFNSARLLRFDGQPSLNVTCTHHE